MKDCDKILQKWHKHLLLNLNYSENTINSYDCDIKLLQDFLLGYRENATIFTVQKSDIRAWILSRYNTKCNAKTIARGLSAIKNLHKFLLDEHIIKNSDILSMRSPKITSTLPRPLSTKQLNNLIESARIVKKTSWIVKREKALIVLLYATGLRISEALSLKISDINEEFLSITGKGGKTRFVPLLQSVKELLNDYVKSIPFSSNFLFLNRFGKKLHPGAVQYSLRNIRRKIGLPETVTPHAMRHTCATHIMENSGDLRSVQELLGHQSVCSTQIYADITGRFINQTYKKCHPLATKNNTKNKPNILNKR